MVHQGDLPNPRPGNSAPRLPGTDALPFCCVYSYTDENEIVGAECVELDDTFDETECTKFVNNPLDPGAPQRQRGVVAECCRDCELLARKLIITRCSNRTFIAGTGRILPYTSPAESPEDCCCGDVPRCVQVPGCNQVDCYPEPPDSGDKCDGRCLSMEYDAEGNEIVEDRGLLCATKVQCCADDNSSCMDRCYDSVEAGVVPEPVIMGPTNQWTPMACTTGCGVCCTHVYDTTTGSDTYGQSMFRLGVTSLTQEECEADFYDPNTLGPVLNPVSLGPVGDWVANTDDTNVCNPACCLDRQRGQTKEAICYYTDQLYCDPCKGRCIDVTAENDPGMCPREFCATKQECCGAGGEKCETGRCGPGTPALYRWEAMPCVENAADLCGVCCKNEYAVNGQVSGVVCDPATNTRADCERIVTITFPPPDDPDAVPPPSLSAQYGTWAPFETCRACAEFVPCCREIECPDGIKAICVDVPPDECDFCNGRCVELATGKESCAHFSDCCGPDGKNCVETCGQPPTHSWIQTCANPSKCGVCCRTLYSVDPVSGEQTYLSSSCFDDMEDASECVLTEEEAESLQPAFAAVYTWIPFVYDTCATARCASKKCCGQKCPNGEVGCIDIDIDEPCDPCKGRCLNNNTGDDFCATKQECCGEDGANCRECPDGSGPAFEWSGCFENESKCGVCCEFILNDAGDVVGSICRDISYNACLALPNASWRPFETCETAICIPKQCCKEVCPEQIGCITVDKDRDNCNQCEGFCSEVDADGNIIASTTFCETERNCCEWDGRRCIGYPDAVCPGVDKNRTWSRCQVDPLPECVMQPCPPLPQNLQPAASYTISFDSPCPQSWFNVTSWDLPKISETPHPQLPHLKTHRYGATYAGKQGYFCPAAAEYGQHRVGTAIMWQLSGDAITLGAELTITPVVTQQFGQPPQHVPPYWSAELYLISRDCGGKEPYVVCYSPWSKRINCSTSTFICATDPTVFTVRLDEPGEFNYGLPFVHIGKDVLFSGCVNAPPNSWPEWFWPPNWDYDKACEIDCCPPVAGCTGFDCEMTAETFAYQEMCADCCDEPGCNDGTAPCLQPQNFCTYEETYYDYCPDCCQDFWADPECSNYSAPCQQPENFCEYSYTYDAKCPGCCDGIGDDPGCDDWSAPCLLPENYCTYYYTVCGVKRCPDNYPVKVSLGGAEGVLWPSGNNLP